MPVNHWGGQGPGAGEFSFPSGIAVDGQGDVYVADTYNNRVQRLTRSKA
jgi:DNA-binding beta-propeller fold protein YncE